MMEIMVNGTHMIHTTAMMIFVDCYGFIFNTERINRPIMIGTYYHTIDNLILSVTLINGEHIHVLYLACAQSKHVKPASVYTSKEM